MKKKLRVLLSLMLVLSFIIGYSPTFAYATEIDKSEEEETIDEDEIDSKTAPAGTSEDVIEEDSIDSKTEPAGEFATGDSIPKDLFTTDATYDN